MSKNKICCPQEPLAKSKSPSKKDRKTLLIEYTKAIGHPIRLQILDILKTQKGCICGDLVDQLPVAQATVSQHLKVLKNAGLIRGTISGPSTCYCIDQAALEEFKSLIKNF